MRLVWRKWAKFSLGTNPLGTITREGAAGARRSRQRRPMLTMVGLAIALLGASIAPGSRMLAAGAQSPLDVARAEVAAATLKVETLNVEIAAAQGRADAATAVFWEQQETVYLLESTISELESAVTDLENQRSSLKQEVQRIAIDRYMEPVNFESVIDAHALNAKMRADALASLVTGTSEDAIEELREVSAERTTSVIDLQDRLDRRDAAAAAAVAAGEELTAELAGLDERRGELLEELAELESQLERLEAAEAERVAAAAERARLEIERERAEAAAALAAEIVEAAPTPEPTPSAFEPNPRRSPAGAPADADSDSPQAANDELPAEGGAGDDQSGGAGDSADEPADSETLTTGASEADADASEAAESTPPEASADQVAETSESESGPVPTAQPVPTAPPVPTVPPVPAATPVPAVPEPEPTPEPQPFAQSGPIVCPLDGPFSHIDDYGAPRPGGRSHQGNDLMAATGTPVLAVVSGHLEHKFGNVGGYTARIKADDGGWYYFAHLSAYENQGAGWVAAGTVIGYVGNTGDAIHTPPHLHFEMHPTGYGSPINPYSSVVASC